MTVAVVLTFSLEKFSGVFSFRLLVMIDADADQYDDKYYGEVRDVAGGASESARS